MVIKAQRKILSGAEIKKLIRTFYNTLLREKIPFEELFLFGSYAQGIPGKDSDIDIAVVVSSSMSHSGRKKIADLPWIAKQVDIKLEPHVISVRDFNNGWLSFPSHIRKTGKRISR